MIFLSEAVLSAGDVCRQFDVCSLERSSLSSSQKGKGFLQEFLVLGVDRTADERENQNKGDETVETVENSCRSLITLLKQGVNEMAHLAE